MWTTCNANLAGGHHQELAMLKIVSVFRKHGIEVIDLGLQLSSWEPTPKDLPSSFVQLLQPSSSS
jgi:hypothetical protein